jgi:hypothetical protein
VKICTKCGESKDSSEFYSNGKNGQHTACKACNREDGRLRRLANPDSARIADAEKHQRRKGAANAHCREYHAQNAGRRSEVEKARYIADSDRIKRRTKEYRDANKHKVMAWNGKRRALVAQATPTWADIDLIAAAYRLASDLTASTGVIHHVDHVIPLKGKTVCGLHVQSNLAVIPAVDNLRKGARLTA